MLHHFGARFNSEYISNIKYKSWITTIPFIMTKMAFTLAEVLITLGIIGVVAALTMPALISNHQDKVKITKLKKAFSVLSNAYIQTQAKYGDIENWTDVDLETFIDTRPLSQQLSNDIGYKFAEIIRYDKICTNLDDSNKCWGRTNPLSFLNGTGHGGGTYFTLISNGIIYGITSHVDVKGNNKIKTKFYAQVHVDVDMHKNPSVLGKNVFTFLITDKGILPGGTGQSYSDFNSYTPFPFETYCLDKGTLKQGSGCTAWVLQNENFEYLKACSNLSLNGERTCK